MKSVAEVVKTLKKSHGDKAITYGVTTYEAPRIPFGIFEIDYMTGGGVPRGRLTEIFGAESGGKTNLAILAIVQAQRMYPDEYAVFIDAEHATDRAWMNRLGVNQDKLIYVRPAFGEQIMEATERFLGAHDVSIIVIDSTAAIAGMAELEQDAEKGTPGNATQLLQRMMKRVTFAYDDVCKEWEDGHRGPPAALIMINQVRQKIGVMFGSPESTPGGNMLKHTAGMRIRVYGKNIVDNKVTKALPVRKNMTCTMVKWKVPIIAMACEFDMAVIKHNGFREGEVDSWNTVEAMLKHHKFLAKDPKKGWWLNTDKAGAAAEQDGAKFDTLIELRAMFRQNFDFRTAVLADLFEAGKAELVAEGDIEPLDYDPTTGEVIE